MSYGGGHASIVRALAQGLISAGYDPTVVGLTTGLRPIRRSGISALSISDVIDCQRASYERARELIQPFVQDMSHPDIEKRETEDYFAIGLHDLIDAYGEHTALARLTEEGRTAFLPVATMRRFIEALRPSCVVATTGPRFERALLMAARELDVPSIAVADLFLKRERPYVLADDYAEHLCVMNHQLKAELDLEATSKIRIHATGNPAFDALKVARHDTDQRIRLRQELGVNEAKVVLWPSAPVQYAEFTDRPFALPEEVAHAMEAICLAQPDYRYIMRPHPNGLYDLPNHAVHGLLDPGLSPEQALMVADIVCFEITTVGLQASLMGKPTICVGFADLAVFPEYGYGLTVDSLEEMTELLKTQSYSTIAEQGVSEHAIPEATNRVISLIQDVSLQ